MRAIMLTTLSFVAGCFVAGSAIADQGSVKVYSLSVQERLENLELINFTSEKTPIPDEVALDDELAEILREVEALEAPAEDDQ